MDRIVLALAFLLLSFALFGQINSSVLADGRWYRFPVTETGVYVIRSSDLQNAGIDVDHVDPEYIRIYGNGGEMLPDTPGENFIDDLAECPVFFTGNSNGIFDSGDSLLFYAEGPVTLKYNADEGIMEHEMHLYSIYSWYYIKIDTTEGLHITAQPSTDLLPNNIVTTFNNLAWHEVDSVNFIRSGRSWAGESFNTITSRDFTFVFPGIDASVPVNILTHTYARYSDATTYDLTVNNIPVGSISHSSVNMTSEYTTYVSEKSENFSYTSSSDTITVTLTYNKPDPSAIGWLDYLTINAERKLQMNDEQTRFRNISSAENGNISRFRLACQATPFAVWNITDPHSITSIDYVSQNDTVIFTLETDSLLEFILLPYGNFLCISGIEPVENQNLHGLPQPDMIVVSHPDFLTYAQQLADHHTAYDTMNVVVVTDEQVYNEYSSGKPDPAAIRNFAKMFYDRAGTLEEAPGYLLLFGDGSYDNRNISGNGNNFIITYQSANSIKPTSSFTSDDFFGILEDEEAITTGTLDISTGRLPVRYTSDAQAMVDKIVGYSTYSAGFGSWRNDICFIGDDEDGNQHMTGADILATYTDTVAPVYNISKIYLDAYQQFSTPEGDIYPDADTAVNRQIDKGALLINYTGHGNDSSIAHEMILDTADVEQWTNSDRLPIFMLATCTACRYDFEGISLGERMLLRQEGGGIVIMGPSRLTYASSNSIINQDLIDEFLDNKNQRIGDIFRYVKNNNPGTNTRNFVLLGDPAVKPAYPNQEIITSAINGYLPYPPADTIHPGDYVTITGYIADTDSNLLSGFNGVLYYTVFDKKQYLLTLANDGGTPFSYWQYGDTIAEGTSVVTGGEFEFSFIASEAIAPGYDYGKISYYAYSSSTDAHGYFNGIISGTDSAMSVITIPEKYSLRIFPTLTDGRITIETGNAVSFQNCTLEVTDITGNLVFSQQNALQDEWRYYLDASEYKSGIYIVRITDRSGVYTGRFVRQ
ncbi:MAG: type IX secretion system sortase PorU [Bacteroidetes bacterium]|nr:type IX secretion system sortase PorU [Bacteroidota bacterium]